MLQYRRHCLQNITSDVGIKLRINRSIQVEGAFGVIKEDYAFRRFLTIGKRKTETQFFLIAFAFNILKFHNKSINGRLKTELFDMQACWIYKNQIILSGSYTQLSFCGGQNCSKFGYRTVFTDFSLAFRQRRGSTEKNRCKVRVKVAKTEVNDQRKNVA